MDQPRVPSLKVHLAEFASKFLKPEPNQQHLQVHEEKAYEGELSPNHGGAAEVGHASAQGVRPTMEDQIDYRPEMTIKGRQFSYYAVFDGHGGKAAAEYARSQLCDNLTNELSARLPDGVSKGVKMEGVAREQGQPPSEPLKSSQAADAQDCDAHIREALVQAFLKTDEAFLRFQNDRSGTTAVCALLDRTSQYIYVANAGDSRAVLCRKGQAIPMSRDHKADRPDEVERIERAGGFVFHKRVLGQLAVSRGLGDVEYKAHRPKPLVIAHPEIICEALGSDDEFLVLACDGLWDVLSNEQVSNFVRKALFADNLPAQKVSEMLVREALNNNTRDNVSTLIVRLKFPKQAKTLLMSPGQTFSPIDVPPTPIPSVPNEADPASSSKPRSPPIN